jgi:hypothetical protein
LPEDEYDLSVFDDPEKHPIFFIRRKAAYCLNAEDDRVYKSHLQRAVQGYRRDIGTLQAHYAEELATLCLLSVKEALPHIKKTTPTVYMIKAGPPHVVVKQNTAQVYGDFIERRLALGDPDALPLKIEGLRNGTLGYEKDEALANQLASTMAPPPFAHKMEVQNVMGNEAAKAAVPLAPAVAPDTEVIPPVPATISSAPPPNAVSDLDKVIGEITATPAQRLTVARLRTLFSQIGGRVDITTRKKGKISQMHFRLKGRSLTLEVKGNNKLAIKRDVTAFLKDF